MAERYILKELGFNFYRIIESPHKHLLDLMNLVNGTDSLAQLTWNYMNDSCRLDFCIRFRPIIIASACVTLAIQKSKFVIDSNREHWLEAVDCNRTDVESVSIEILSLYDMNIINWIEPSPIPHYLSPDICADDVFQTTNMAMNGGFDDYPGASNDQMKKSSWRDRLSVPVREEILNDDGVDQPIEVDSSNIESSRIASKGYKRPRDSSPQRGRNIDRREFRRSRSNSRRRRDRSKDRGRNHSKDRRR